MFAFPGSKPTMAGKAGCNIGRWKRTFSFMGCAGGEKSLVSWFAGAVQMEEGCGLLKMGSGGDKLCGIWRENRMFAAGGNAGLCMGLNGGSPWGC